MLVQGRVSCPYHPELISYLTVELHDLDPLPWEIDDLMGRSHTFENGTFQVSGCGSDLGPSNTPDPYLKITHFCPAKNTKGIPLKARHLKVDVIPVFLPNILKLGRIRLDDDGY
ncbi:unnamed protein product, partial [Mesorhabditis spiculigera]